MGHNFVLYMAVIVLSGISNLVLMSLGLSIIFGVMGIINFAHGEFMMLGAYALVVLLNAGVPFAAAVPLASIIVGLIGLAIERAVIRHLYGRMIDTILATWGISIVLVQLVVIIFGTTGPGIPTPLGSFHIGLYSISQYTFVMMGVTGGLVVALHQLLSRTRYGIEAQATAQSRQMASALGVNAERTMMLTFTLGSALAGAAGAVFAPTVGLLPQMGLVFLARAFMGVITGGQAILSGLAGASSVLGTTESIVSVLTQPFLGQAALLLVALVVLRLMPQGVSGNWRRKL